MIAQNKTLFTQQTTSYILPKFLSEVQHVTSIDTGNMEFIICCDRMKLYIFPLVSPGNKLIGAIHQTLPIPNIKSLKTIAKNFLMIETQSKYIGIFQIIKSTSKENPNQKAPNITTAQINAPKVQFSEVLRWKLFSSYFIREVMENLFEVQVFYTDLDFEIFQFTNKFKRGSMSFTIAPNGKIVKSTKKQLYGSKSFLNLGRKLMYWLKNFSDKQFVLQQIIQSNIGSNKTLFQPLGYFGIQRAQQYKSVYANFVVRDCINPVKKHRIQFDKHSFLNQLKSQYALLSPSKKKLNSKGQQQNPYTELVQQSNSSAQNIYKLIQDYKITIFSDLIMIQNKSTKEMEIYQIRAQGSEIIGRQNCSIHSYSYSQNKEGNKNSENPIFKEMNEMQEIRRWQWFFGNSKKLIALDRIGLRLKCLDQTKFLSNRTEIQTQQKPPVSNNKIQNVLPIQIQSGNDKIQVLKQQNLTNQSNEVKNPIVYKDQSIQPDNILEAKQKRKFSREELQKFCTQFPQKGAQEFVSKDLIKKVEEVKNWVKGQQKIKSKWQETYGQNKAENKVLKDTKQCITKSENKQIASSQNHQQKEIKRQVIVQKNKQLHNKIPSSFNEIQKEQKIINQPSLYPASEHTVPNLLGRQKPPMKIIQRNKISVAKTFNPSGISQGVSNQNQKSLKQTQQGKKQQKRNKIVSEDKEKSNVNKESRQKLINNKGLPSQLLQNQNKAKQSVQNVQKQRKRFIVPNKYIQKPQQSQVISDAKQLTQTSKGIQNKNVNKITEKPVNFQETQLQNKQQHKQTKEVKKRFNVLTRANQQKKIQVLNQSNEILVVKNQIKQKHVLSLTQNNQFKQNQQEVNINQTKNNINIEQIQASNRGEKQKSGSQNQQKPKTKFIPSINSDKIARNQMNNCDFLSQDSRSQTDQKEENKLDAQIENTQINKIKDQPSDSQSSITEQIQIQNKSAGDQKSQKDMEYLIDDDITKNKQPQSKKAENNQDELILKQQDTHTQIEQHIQQKPLKRQPSQQDQQKQIQKFCNSLLDEDSPLGYKKSSSQSSKKKSKKQEKNSNFSILAFQTSKLNQKALQNNKKSITITEESVINQAIKQQANQMNQFGSLLFKTSIKRNKIFASENQNIQNNLNKPQAQQISSSNNQRNASLQQVQTQIISSSNLNEIQSMKQIQLIQPNQKVQQTKQKVQQNLQQKQKKKTQSKKFWADLSEESESQIQNQNKQQNQPKLNQPKQNQTLKQEKPINIEQFNKATPLTNTNQIYQKNQSQHNQNIQQVSKTMEQMQQTIKNMQLVGKTITNQTQKKQKQNPFLQELSQRKPLNNSSESPSIFANPVNWLQNRPSTNIHKNIDKDKDQNPFINFKKHVHQINVPSQNSQNLFSSNPGVNLFRKFLHERQKSKSSTTKQTQINKVQKQISKPQTTQKINTTPKIEVFQKHEKQHSQSQKIQVHQKSEKQHPEIKQTKQTIRKQQTIQLIPISQAQAQAQIKANQQQKINVSKDIIPQIQQLIQKYQDFALSHLKSQQIMILKAIQQIPHTHNPYNKNHSLIITEEIKQEIIKQSKLALKKWLSSKMLDKIEVSFREIMKEHKSVYEQALNFYEAEAKRKITTMQLQYQQQSSILTDMENISANMCASLQSTILEGQQLHTYQLKQWKKQIQQKQTSILAPLLDKIDQSNKFFQIRNHNLTNLSDELKDIKEILKQKIRIKQQKKQLRQKQKQKIEQEKIRKQQEKLKKQQKKLKKHKEALQENQKHHEREQKSKKLKKTKNIPIQQSKYPQYQNTPYFNMNNSQQPNYSRPLYGYQQNY